MSREFRPLTPEEKLFVTIARGHDCPVCGKLHLIGNQEERNAWDCIANTSQGIYIAQCEYCGGLIEIKGKNDPRDSDYKGENNVKTEPKKCDTIDRGRKESITTRTRLFN